MQDQSGTFFTHIRTLSQQQAPTEQPAPVPAPRKGPPGWLIPFAIVALSLQVVGVLTWYSLREQAETRTSLNSTLAKLVTIEKYGYDMRGYHAQVREQDVRLRSIFSLLFPPLIHQVQAEVTQMDTQLTSQYSTILEKEKGLFREKIASAEAQMMQSRIYTYPSKEKVIAGVEKLKSKVDESKGGVEEVATFTQELEGYQNLMKEELHEVLHDEFAELEKEYSVSVNYNYPSRTTIETFIEDYGSATEAKIPELHVTLGNLRKVDEYTRTIKNEVEEQKRQLVFNTITNTTKDVDELLAFFSQRSGYTNEIAQLNQYKNLVARYVPSNFTNVTSNELQRQAETELYPLTVQPKETKKQAVEKEQQELIARQKKLEAENGIPVPPVDKPKLVLIDITKQRLYAYENGVSIFNEPVPITSGKAGFDTVKGNFAIYQKMRGMRLRSPFPGIYYDSYVDFWMPFFQGYGLHDASWRTVYGTMDYPSVGSHGCVNIPYNYVQQIFNWAEVGTSVVVR